MTSIAQLKTSLALRYDVEREIGQGGMATVYLARDLRHDRPVALKVLKPELGAVLGADRFLAEIKVTANLQHPNLLPLFDSGEVDGLLFYVMPFVEGESLRAKLDREKQLPVEEAIRIAASVAGALDYAHMRGVIHRDLKPENVLLHAGQPVLADFGIALAVANAGGNRVTQTGLSLGTPQYMSPEQATGDRAIDGRTDIYSLGAVLYEMLTGEPPHTGSTAQAVIARVLTDKPRRVRASRETVPAHVEAAIERALMKLPADRFATARDFCDAITGARPVALTNGDMRAAAADDDVRFSIARPKAKMRAAMLALAAAVVAIGAWGWLRPVAAPSLRARFSITLDGEGKLRSELGGSNIAVSPDGSQFVYLGGAEATRLYIRAMNELEAKPIAGTERAASPKFSPDGQWLAFVSRGALRKIPLAGGPAVTISDNVGRYSWGDNGVIVLAQNGDNFNSGLWRVSAAGGPQERLTQPDTARGETGHTWPEMLPGGKAVVFAVTKGPLTGEVAAVDLETRKISRFGVSGINPRFVRTGHLLLGQPDGGVVAVPFDHRRLRVTGPAVTVVSGVLVKGGGAVELGVSRNGTLVYVEGETMSHLTLVDRSGAERPLSLNNDRASNPRFARDGNRIAFAHGPSNTVNDIWVHDLASGTTTRITSDGLSDRPEWTADGRRLAWRHRASTGAPSEMWWQPWDGSGKPEVLAGSERGFFNLAFSPTGSFFAATKSDENADIYITPLDSLSVSRPAVIGSGTKISPKVSPDGRWLAYVSSQTGGGAVFVSSTTGTGGRHQISVDGGREPLWDPGGRALYYRGNGYVMMASITASPNLVVARRDTVFRDNFVRARGRGAASYDVSPDGEQFLMLSGGDEPQKVIVVFGWLDELRERMAQASKN